jgi:hypothetical protein
VLEQLRAVSFTNNVWTIKEDVYNVFHVSGERCGNGQIAIGELYRLQNFSPLFLGEKNAVFELIRSFPNVDRQLPVEFMKALYELPTIIPAEEGK